MPLKTEPNPSLLHRMFGGLSNSSAKQWPELEQAWHGREIEMPKETARTGIVRPMNIIERAMNPDAYAKTSMFGNIALNRPMIEGHNQNLSDVLVHELTHVGQGKSGFLKKYLNPSAVENEAVNKEGLRNVRRTDIELR